MSISPLRRRSPLARLVALTALASVAACGGGDSPPGPSNSPAALQAASVTTQSATVGTAVAAAPAVTVLNASGQPVAGATVTFTVTAGGGSIGAATAQSNASGVASAGSWTLGPTAGANSVSATLGALTPVVFTATGQAVVQAATQLTLVSGGAQTDTVQSALTPVVVRVLDAAGTPVAGAQVNFLPNAGGAVDPLSVTTGANGQAQAVWRLGNTVGAQTLTATVSNTTITPLVVTATATQPPFFALQLDVARLATCGLRQNVGLVCFGVGYLGDGSGQDDQRFDATTVAVPGVTFVQVVLGTEHRCARASTGAAYCWGRNQEGALGDGTNTARLTPTLVTGAHTFKTLALGSAHSCAIRSDDTAWCWGLNGNGQLGTGGAATAAAPTAVAGGHVVRGIAAGGSHSCAVTSANEVLCWGANGDGQLGDASTTSRPVPVAAAMPAGVSLQWVTAGGAFTCALTPAGTAYCWGDNQFGQLGDGSTTDRLVPTPVAGNLTFASIDAGETYACGVTTAGALYCWGKNDQGQLGIGSVSADPNAATSTPQLVAPPAGQTWKSVAAAIGGQRVCATTSANRSFCWGTNSGGLTSGLPVVAAPVAVRGR